jgi:hypothetical protein
MATWIDFERDDLNAIPLAFDKGWLPEFDYKDKRAGRFTPENIPMNAVSFKKGNKYAWKIYHITSPKENEVWGDLQEIWRVAELVDGYYCNHRTYNTIQEVFEKE